MFAANYLFRTAGVRWALDPVSLLARMGMAHERPVAGDLAGLDFVVLSHRHGDHHNAPMINAMAGLPARWVVPRFMLERVEEETDLPAQRITVAEPGEAVQLSGIRLTPFEAVHYDPGTDSGVPSLGYFIEAGDRRLLLPGDNRSYEPDRFPEFGPVDVLFANLWFGRRAGLVGEPPYFKAFCEFCLAFGARKIVIAHLREVARAPEDYWTGRHARMAVEYLAEKAPDVPVLVPEFGERIPL
jgi:hypothetical protein